MLSENLQRKDLTEVEKAEAIFDYLSEASMTAYKFSKISGINEGYIRNLLTLHGYPTEVKQLVKSGDVSAESVRPLKQLETDTEKIKTAQYIADNELNHKQAKQVVEVVKNQLTESQRGMIAANMKPLYEKEARERQIKLAGTRLTDDLRDHGREGIEKGRTSEIVGKMFGVSRGTVDRASAVIKNGVEELQEAVKAGKSTFQWVGGYKKYTYFVYIWDTLYLKYL